MSIHNCSHSEGTDETNNSEIALDDAIFAQEISARIFNTTISGIETLNPPN